MTSANADADSGVTILYDGACPFCATYVKHTRLEAAAGPVRLVDARQGGPEVEEAERAGIDLDQGMAVAYGGRLYHGADSLVLLSTLTSRAGLWNRAMARLFARSGRARALYPFLKAGRNAALWLLGRGRIEPRAQG